MGREVLLFNLFENRNEINLLSRLCIFQKLHLPPEFSDTASRAQEETMKITKSNIVASSSDRTRKKILPKNIDF